jgi:predicted cation transporter
LHLQGEEVAVFVELFVLAAVVILLPLFVKKVGENLELFLFAAGILAVTLTSEWSQALVREALEGPLTITLAVLLASLLFYLLQRPLERSITRLQARMGSRLLVFLIIALVGLLSSFVTAIIASLVMVEAVSRLKLGQRTEVAVVVLACFSIGLGAALTPFGEPLAAVAITKLAGDPYRAQAWFLLKNLWMYVIPGILVVSAASVFFIRRRKDHDAPAPREERETLFSAFLRTGKVYLFVVGLILLGAGFTPVIDLFISKVSYLALFWANISSAVLDNATLTAAEIAPSMKLDQIVAGLMGLLIAGGMLVPGNIPNVIAAGRLKIDSRAWARVGVPVGMSMMLAMFAALVVRG